MHPNWPKKIKFSRKLLHFKKHNTILAAKYKFTAESMFKQCFLSKVQWDTIVP